MAARDCNCFNVARTCTACANQKCGDYARKSFTPENSKIPVPGSVLGYRTHGCELRLKGSSRDLVDRLTHDKRRQLRGTSNASINLHRHLRPFAKSASAAPLDRGVEDFWSFKSTSQSQCDRSETQACCGWSVLFVGKLHLVLQEVCQVGEKRPYTFRGLKH